MPSRGVHFALTVDDAKRLFAAKGGDQVRQVIQELEEEETVWNERAYETDKAWDAIHRCLTDGTLDPAAGELPLNQAILGGRQMYSGEEYIAALVRPDFVPHVAAALQAIDRDDLRQRYNRLAETDYDGPFGDEDFQYTWDNFEGLVDFFRRAAENRHAVLFTVDQ